MCVNTFVRLNCSSSLVCCFLSSLVYFFREPKRNKHEQMANKKAQAIIKRNRVFLNRVWMVGWVIVCYQDFSN